MARLLVVGGAGFIGSHTCISLLNLNHKIIVLDNFSNSSPRALERAKNLSKIKNITADIFSFKEGDIRDEFFLNAVFEEYISKKEPIEAVIHFAGLKSVQESFIRPNLYWDINVNGTINLIKAMQKHNCKVMVFSSSATIYGYPDVVPIPELATINPLNPYGNTKATIESFLSDIAGCSNTKLIKATSNNGWKIARLRYFNPVGAHPSGLIGEDPKGMPNNLFPYINQVAIGKIKSLQIFGDNWPTHDGTGVRDYIHVMDLAEGHCAALENLLIEKPQLLTLNLGTGKGTSVIEVLKAFEKITDKKIPYEIVSRRTGDSAIAIADVTMAKKIINWQPKKGLEEMCRDSWRWQISNTSGY